MMADIQGLTDDQNTGLAASMVGDLLLVRSVPKPAPEDPDEDDQDNEDDESGDGDGSEDGSDGENDGEGPDVEDSVDEDGEDERAEESDVDEEDSSQTDEEGADEDSDESFTALYRISSFVNDSAGTILDFVLEPMTYCAKPQEAGTHSYHIYGKQVIHTPPPPGSKPSSDITTTKLTELVKDDTMQYSVLNSVDGDQVRRSIFFGRCPADCEDGRVASQKDVHELVTESLTTVTEHFPICPVCIGKDFMEEYQAMRESMETTYQVDMGIAVDFSSRLNPRRREIGYSFVQFDEREWGYLFDDMIEPDEEDDDASNDAAQWGYWPEAMDPNNNAKFTPAADSVIASLPRKNFAEVAKTESNEECLICRTKFENTTEVMELPCGHIFCSNGCGEMWLKQSNQCATCRAKLPTKEEVQAAAVNAFDVEEGEGNDEGDVKFGCEEEEGDEDGFEMDGEDVVMSDVERGITA